MAIEKINNYSQVNSDILAVQLTSDCSFIGKHNVNLTNYDNTSEGQIAAGSIIEVGGALYKVTSDTSISGSPSDGTVYIYMVPSGDTLTPTYTNTAPTWSDTKNGWYGTGGQANYRYAEFVIIKSSTSYTKMMARNDYGFKTNIILEMASIQNISSSGEQTIIFNRKLYDALGEYNPSTGVFTVKQTGFYNIFGCILLADFSSEGGSFIRIRVNDESGLYTRLAGVVAANTVSGVFNCLFYLNAGDYFKITISTGDSNYGINYPYTQCNVVRVS